MKKTLAVLGLRVMPACVGLARDDARLYVDICTHKIRSTQISVLLHRLALLNLEKAWSCCSDECADTHIHRLYMYYNIHYYHC